MDQEEMSQKHLQIEGIQNLEKAQDGKNRQREEVGRVNPQEPAPIKILRLKCLAPAQNGKMNAETADDKKEGNSARSQIRELVDKGVNGGMGITRGRMRRRRG